MPPSTRASGWTMTAFPDQRYFHCPPGAAPERRARDQAFIATQPLGTAGLVIILIMFGAGIFAEVGGAL